MQTLSSKNRFNENLRLLYVAVTRAKRQLHILGACATGTTPRSGSLLRLLWPVIEQGFNNCPIYQSSGQTAGSSSPYIVPSSPRLRLNWRFPDLPEVYSPQIHVSETPSEMVLTDESHVIAYSEKTTEIDLRVTGILYHAMMERMGKEGLDQWTDTKIEEQHKKLISAARRYGVPEPKVESTASKVIQLAKNSLSSPDVAWFLGQHPVEKCEYALSGYYDNVWFKAVIDRFFVDNEGVCWVIDYKTFGCDLSDQETRSALDHEVLSYSPQLSMYKNIMKQKYKVVCCALYFPAIDFLYKLII